MAVPLRLEPLDSPRLLLLPMSVSLPGVPVLFRVVVGQPFVIPGPTSPLMVSVVVSPISAPADKTTARANRNSSLAHRTASGTSDLPMGATTNRRRRTRPPRCPGPHTRTSLARRPPPAARKKRAAEQLNPDMDVDLRPRPNGQNADPRTGDSRRHPSSREAYPHAALSFHSCGRLRTPRCQRDHDGGFRDQYGFKIWDDAEDERLDQPGDSDDRHQQHDDAGSPRLAPPRRRRQPQMHTPLAKRRRSATAAGADRSASRARGLRCTLRSPPARRQSGAMRSSDRSCSRRTAERAAEAFDGCGGSGTGIDEDGIDRAPLMSAQEPPAAADSHLKVPVASRCFAFNAIT